MKFFTWLKNIPFRKVGLGLKKIWRPTVLIIGSLLLGLSCHFPLEALLVKYLRQASEHSNIQITVGQVKQGLLSTTLSDVVIDGSVQLYLDQFFVRPAKSVLWLQPDAYVAAKRGDGIIAGIVGLGKDTKANMNVVDLEIHDIGLGQSLPLGINLYGLLSGTVGFDMAEKSPSNLTGTTDLSIDQARLELPQGFPLPVSSITFRSIKIRLEATAGNIRFANVRLDGDMISGTIQGNIQLRNNVSLSRVDLTARLEFSPELDSQIRPLASLIKLVPDGKQFRREFRGSLATAFR